MRSVVVLPAPVGPSRTTKAPSGIGQRHAVERGVRAEGLGDVVRATTSAMASTLSLAAERERAALFGLEDREGAGVEGEAGGLADRDRIGRRRARALSVAVRGVEGDDLGGAEVFGRHAPGRGRGRRRRGGCARAARRGRARRGRPRAGPGRATSASPRRMRSAPGATVPSKGRKFIGGEPMKSATNIVAGQS